MLEIEIDGNKVEAPDGSTVIEAANLAGAYIPHFCYHKKLSIAANCRMCLVQVEKAPKPLPACATPVTPGMKVWTQSETARKAQQGVMEFLLINHPLDCPVCDQGGECQLQDLSVGYGAAQSRYEEEKRVVSDKDLGPLVKTELTRCINCTRCVRFTQEIAGLMELGQAFRGEKAEIMPFVEQTVTTELSGNIIDLCPVGALTSKPFRFSARTWELSRRKSISSHDSFGSNIIIQTKHDVVKRVLPLENEHVNECWISDRDRFSYEGLTSPDRLLHPMIRHDGHWRKSSWDAALSLIADQLMLADKNSDSVAWFCSPSSTVEELALAKRLCSSMTSGYVESRLRQIDHRLDSHFQGTPWLGCSIKQIAEYDRLLVVGSFLRKDNPLLCHRVRQAAKRSLRVAAMSGVRDDWRLPVKTSLLSKPSQFPEMLRKVSQVIIQRQSNQTDCSIQDSDIAQLANLMASGQRKAIWLGSVVLSHPDFSSIYMAAKDLAELVGADIGIIPEGANAVGAGLLGATSAGLGVNGICSKQPAVCFSLNAEPSFDFSDGPLVRNTLQSAKLSVGLLSFMPTAADAEVFDVLLPVSSFAETAGTYVNCEGRVQVFNSATKSVGEARPGWKIIRVIGSLCDYQGFEKEDISTVREEILPVLSSKDKLSNSVLAGENLVIENRSLVTEFERIADVPIYFADPLVRRAPSLQMTRDATPPVLRVSSSTADVLRIVSGSRVVIDAKGARCEVAVEISEHVANGVGWLSTAHELTSTLPGYSTGFLVERI